MYVCVCHSVTDRDIIKAAENGASSLEDLSNELNVATCCGRCATCAKGLLRQCGNAHQATQQIQSINAA